MEGHIGRRRAAAPRWRRGWLAWGTPAFLGVAMLASVLALVGVMRSLGDAACAAEPASVPAADALALPAAVPQPGSTKSGHATYFDLAASGGSGCSYKGPPADGLYVALGFNEFANGAACGTYLTVSGPNGSVKVQVVDSCEPCDTGHIDLSEKAFSRLADPVAGDVRVTYRALANPSVPGPLKIQMNDSNEYYLAILVINHGNQLTSVEVNGGGGWQNMSRQGDGYWIANNGAGGGPFRVRITDIQGNVKVLSGVDLAPGQVQSTGVMMYGAGSAPGSTPKRKTSPTPKPSPSKKVVDALPHQVSPLPPTTSAPAAGLPLAAEPTACG